MFLRKRRINGVTVIFQGVIGGHTFYH